MENASANVKRIHIMQFKEFKNIVKKDENVAAVFSVCIEHYSKARNRDLEFSLNSFHLFLASFWHFEKFPLEFIELTEFNFNTFKYKHFKVTFYGYLQERAYRK